MTLSLLDNKNYLEIKQAILDPDNSNLSQKQQEILQRCVSGARLLDKYPVIRNAVKIHKTKYPHITDRQAYRDMLMAQMIFCSTTKFDYDFWHEWLLSNIVRQIQRAENSGDLKAWNAGHMALIKAIGERPVEETDPKLVQKHKFTLTINNGKQSVSVDLDKLNLIPQKAREQIADGLYQEITDVEAEEIMNT